MSSLKKKTQDKHDIIGLERQHYLTNDPNILLHIEANKLKYNSINTYASELASIKSKLSYVEQDGMAGKLLGRFFCSWFVHGHTSPNNLRRYFDILYHTNELNSQNVILSFDAEKAFNRDEWKYLLSFSEALILVFSFFTGYKFCAVLLWFLLKQTPNTTYSKPFFF